VARDSQEARLIVTRLMRQRHQITDALRQAADLLQHLRRLDALGGLNNPEAAL
jgi:PleD family two-component response regulator